MKNKVNEWQELSLKKDVEKILKLLSQKQTLDFSIIMDLAIAVVALLLDKLLEPAATGREWLFWLLFIPSMLLLGWHAALFIIDIVKKHNSRYNVYSCQDLIDTFDNDICYYVMMADAYNQMLNEAISNNTAANGNNGVSNGSNKNDLKSVPVFYYIETWYCINKAKAKLYSMRHKTKQVFTTDEDDVVRKNRILLSRLVNIVMIMEEIRESTNGIIKNKLLDIPDKSAITMNVKYDQNFEQFIKEINENFSNSLSLNFKEVERFVLGD